MEKPPLQFRLRTLFIATLIVAVECCVIAGLGSNGERTTPADAVLVAIIPFLTLFGLSGTKVRMALILAAVIGFFEVVTRPAVQSARLDIQIALPAALLLSAAVLWVIIRVG